MSKRAAIYVRISDDRESLRLGVDRQEEDCRELAAKLGYDEVVLHPENDTSASTRSKKPRPLFEEMMTAAESGGYAAIIAYSSSRLTRRPRENERLIELYEKHHVKIHYVNANDNDLSTARGRYSARNDAARDAEEAEQISERVKRASLQRAQQGRGNGGTRPYGWRSDDRTKLDPTEHAVIRDLADRLLAGESLHSVVRDLNARKITTVRGGPWTVATVSTMMTNLRLCGIRMHKGERMGIGNWEPALTELTVRQLRRVLLDPDRRMSSSNSPQHLLSGLARCTCGRKVVAKSLISAGRPRRIRYWCQPCGMSRTSGPVDLYVSRFVRRLLQQYQPTADPGIDEGAQAEADELRELIDDTITRFTGSRVMTPAKLEETLQKLNRQLMDAESRALPPTTSRVVEGLTGSEEEWEALGLERQRAVIDALVTVTLHRGVRGSRAFDPATVQIDRR